MTRGFQLNHFVVLKGQKSVFKIIKSEFKDVAHKTVAELFDMLKGKLAEVDSLKAQLDNMEQCYIQKKKQVEAVNHVLSEMIGISENLHGSWHVLHDAADLCKAEGIDQCVAEIQEALRGGHE